VRHPARTGHRAARSAPPATSPVPAVRSPIPAPDPQCQQRCAVIAAGESALGELPVRHQRQDVVPARPRYRRQRQVGEAVDRPGLADQDLDAARVGSPVPQREVRWLGGQHGGEIHGSTLAGNPSTGHYSIEQ